MPLSTDLLAAKTAVRSALPAHVFDRIERSSVDLDATGQAKRAVAVGTKVELPTLEGIDGRPLNLGSAAAGRPLVLVFTRGGWCPYCSVALRAWAKALPDVDAAGGALVAVTPESREHAAATARDQAVPFPVAIDRGAVFARGLGLVFAVPDDLRPLYRDIGIDLPARNGDDSHALPIPATIVLDAQGRVAFSHVEADFTHRAEPSDVLAALRALPSATSRAA